MVLKRSSVPDAYCTGIVFEVADQSIIAVAIAHMLVQEFTLAQSLVAAPTVQDDSIRRAQAHIDDIVARRLNPPDRYHRDGFLFQLLMWLAANGDLAPDDLLSHPHSQASEKGQDSVIVHRNGNAVVGMTICEDKATDNPRKTVREEVWPEIAEYESGGRLDELRSIVITVLGTGGVPSSEAEKLIRKISWEGK